MKLRKAIKLAAAGAIIGAAPAISYAVNPGGIAYSDMWTNTGGAVDFTCNTTLFVCDTANAIGGLGTADPDFYQITLTDKTTGDVFFETIQLDTAEGAFEAVSFVGQETNTNGANGISSSTYIGETEGSLGATANFDSTSIITTGGKWTGGVGTSGFQSGGPFAGSMRKLTLDQSITTNDGTFGAGFTFDHGKFMDDGAKYEVSAITGFNTDNAEYTGTFEMLETVIEGGSGTHDGLISKTLAAVQDVASAEFDQSFIRNEAEGAAVSDSGVLTAGLGPNQASFTFSAADTIVAMTIDQNVVGAAAKFSLSDAANESGTGEAGVDYHNSYSAAITVSYTNSGASTPYDPFVNF